MESSLPALNWDPGKYNYQRKLGNFVQYFQVNMPTSATGVPLKVIDPVPLAECMLDCETTDDVPDHVLDAAAVAVDFEEGIPVLEGLPLWERFDGELMDYYKLYKEYRDMLYLGSSRSVMKLAAKYNVSGKFINALSKVYHWQLRCKAYDAHRRIERERFRQFEIEQLESSHMKASKVLLEQGLLYLEEHPEQLDPKTALQMVQVAMKAGRLSVGLNAEKPGSGDASPNIRISNTTSMGGSSDSTVASEIRTESSGKDGEQDVTYLQSIVHILDQSGALDKAKQEIIEAEYTEVDESNEAVEGA